VQLVRTGLRELGNVLVEGDGWVNDDDSQLTNCLRGIDTFPEVSLINFAFLTILYYLANT